MNLWKDEPKWLRIAADPRLFAAACAWLFVLVVLGTVAQRDIGLYQAQERYFNGWILWLWHVPLPGGRLTLSLTGLNLLAVLFTRRGTRNPGLFLLHAGTLLLLAGAMVGSALRLEGSLTLAEGETGDEMRSWRHHELAIVVSGAQHDRLVTIGEALLKPGATITHPDLPMPLVVEKHLVNCQLGKGGELVELEPEKEVERNSAGVLLRLPDGRKVAVCETDDAPHLAPGVQAGIRRIGTQVPVAIELLKFNREDHPGTQMARSFSSEVIVHDAGGSRRVVISMNKPLRIDAWTFYQQSYSEGPGGATSVLAVVQDRFQLSPYISSAIMLVGLLVHLFIRLFKRETAS